MVPGIRLLGVGSSVNHNNVGIKKIIIVALVATCLFCSSFVSNVVFAETANLKQKGLTLSPLRTELDITPGTSLNGKMKVTNNSAKPMTVTMSAEVFSVINQQYDYAFTAESNVVKWVSFDHPEINLAPGKSENIAYTVGAPLSAEPGGRYISLFASTDTSDPTSTGIESRQRIASLLYITVLGDVSRVGRLVSLSSPWLIGGDSTWNATLQNVGTTHYRSRYNLQIKDLLWGRTAGKTSGEAMVLPGTIRLVSDKLSAPLLPGLYKAVYNIGLGDNPAVTRTRLIFYLPIWSVIFVITVGIALAYWLGRKQYWKKFSRFVARLYK